jgi:hypothetical protein
MCVQVSKPTQQYVRVTAHFVRKRVCIRLDFETYASGCATQCVRRAHHAATSMCNVLLLHYVQFETLELLHFCSIVAACCCAHQRSADALLVAAVVVAWHSIGNKARAQ